MDAAPPCGGPPVPRGAVTLHAATASAQGPRSTQEDAHCTNAADGVFVVADGHGGRAVAEHVVATLPGRLHAAAEGAADTATLAARVERAFRAVDADMFTAFARRDRGGAACVAVMVCADPDGGAYMLAANLGDCRAVAYFADAVLPLTSDHRASCPREARRVSALADTPPHVRVVSGVNHRGAVAHGARLTAASTSTAVQLTRAFGDFILKLPRTALDARPQSAAHRPAAATYVPRGCPVDAPMDEALDLFEEAGGTPGRKRPREDSEGGCPSQPAAKRAAAASDGTLRHGRLALANTPECTRLAVTAALRCVVLACDGVWDVMSADAVGRLVAGMRHRGAAQLADEIVAAAAAAGSKDNITATAVLFAPRPQALKPPLCTAAAVTCVMHTERRGTVASVEDPSTGKTVRTDDDLHRALYIADLAAEADRDGVVAVARRLGGDVPLRGRLQRCMRLVERFRASAAAPLTLLAAVDHRGTDTRAGDVLRSTLPALLLGLVIEHYYDDAGRPTPLAVAGGAPKPLAMKACLAKALALAHDAFMSATSAPHTPCGVQLVLLTGPHIYTASVGHDSRVVLARRRPLKAHVLSKPAPRNPVPCLWGMQGFTAASVQTCGYERHGGRDAFVLTASAALLDVLAPRAAVEYLAVRVGASGSAPSNGFVDLDSAAEQRRPAPPAPYTLPCTAANLPRALRDLCREGVARRAVANVAASVLLFSDEAHPAASH